MAMVAWIAALLMYPRYKMHQAKSMPGEPLFETMKTASAMLRRIIMIPSMAVTWILGMSLIAINPGIFQLKFMWIKLLLVVAVTALHIYFSKAGRALDETGDVSTVSKFRVLNELPFIALIFIVILVVVKPF